MSRLTDTELLDWLEARKITPYCQDAHDWRMAGSTLCYGTLREAIIAAKEWEDLEKLARTSGSRLQGDV